MAKNGIVLRTADNILDEIDRLHHAVSRRAYDLFRNNGSGFGSAVADWLGAEHELVWRPAVELRRKDGSYEVVAATAGVPAKDLDVQITPDDLLIKAAVDHRHAETEGDVQICEFEKGQLFRSVHFPERIDPAKVTADYHDGLLRVTAPIAKPGATKITVEAAKAPEAA